MNSPVGSTDRLVVGPETGHLFSGKALRNVAAGLILAQALLRASIALKGFYLLDDFELTSLAATEPLGWSYLSRLHAGHLMPGGLAIAWGLDKVAPLSWTATVLSTTLLQLGASCSVWWMLRTLFGRRAAILVLLVGYLIAPLTLDSYLWWTVALNQLPIQMFMALAVTCHVKWVWDLSTRWLVGSAASLVLALCFLEKSILIVPLLLALTAWFLVQGGGWLAGIGRTLRRDTAAWATYTAICLGYFVLYRSRPNSVSFDLGPSLSETLGLARDLIGTTFIPSLFGGPWIWQPLGRVTAVVDPPNLAAWITWALAAVIVVISIQVRKRAARAWAILALYLAVNVMLVAVGRLATFGRYSGLLTRYVVDTSIPTTIVLGLAFLPLVGERDVYTARARVWADRLADRRRVLIPATIGVLAMLMGSAAISTHAYTTVWVDNPARPWVEQAERSLSVADREHPLLDEPVPTEVLPQDYAAGRFRGTSHLLAPVLDRPPFDVYTDVLQSFDGSGNLEPAVVRGFETRRGSPGNCPYTATAAQGATMPLQRAAYAWDWIVHVRYLASNPTTATVNLGSESVDVMLQEGLHDLFVSLTGGGDTVVVDGIEEGDSVCIDGATVGQRNPAEPP